MKSKQILFEELLDEMFFNDVIKKNIEESFATIIDTYNLKHGNISSIGKKRLIVIQDILTNFLIYIKQNGG